jgi:hypothetical protein
MDKLRKTLAGLEIDVEDLPGYLVPFIFTFIAFEIGCNRLSGVLTVPKPLLQLGLVAVSGIVALVVYEAGSFWDDAFFDPRYRPGGSEPAGTWLNHPGHPCFFFPNAKELIRARTSAMETLRPSGGLYKAAEQRVRSRGKWKEARGPLARSKMARSLIFPSFAVALVCVILAFVVGNSLTELLVGALVMLVFGQGLLVVYIRQRVQYLIRLYDLSAESKRHR